MSDDDYMGVPSEIVTEIGRVVVAGTRLEDMIYRIGEGALDIAPIRAVPASQAAEKIRDDVRTYGVPAWSQDRITVAQIDDWTSRTKQVLDLRNEVVHGVHYRVYDGEQWVGHDRRAANKTQPRVTALNKVTRARKAVEEANRSTIAVWHALLPMITEGRGAILYGPDQGVTVVATDIATGPNLTEAERIAWSIAFAGEFGGAPGAPPARRPPE